jgi:hypothetical protein
MAKRAKKMSYSDHWMRQGDYGETRIARMLTRKLKRHEKRANRLRNGLKRINGELYQVCDYQPMGAFNTSWCKYPCEGDC